MLDIVYGRLNAPDCIIDSRVFFAEHKKPEWFEDEFVKRIIKEIDGAEVIFEEALKSRFGHGMSTDKLSTGSKTLICIYYYRDLTFYGTLMGDNCYPLLFEMAKDSDIRIMVENQVPVVKKYVGQFTMDYGKPVTDYWDLASYCHAEYDRWNHFMGFDDDDDDDEEEDVFIDKSVDR